MGTAKITLDQVNGYPGHARVYEISPKLFYDDREYDHILVWVRAWRLRKFSRVSVLPSSSTGAVIGESMRELPGSFTAHQNPFSTPEQLEGCFQWALSGAGQPYLPGSDGGYTPEEAQ